jgi:acetylornithine deacetylase
VNSSSAAEILRELVAIPTPSSQSNLPLLNYVSELLTTLNWQLKLVRYTDDAGVEKANLIARPPSSIDQQTFDLAFICHTDTVPYAADWVDALNLQEADSRLFGCGACDVKGALACFLAAIMQPNAEPVSSGVGLILTADEEIGCKGIERLLAETSLHIRSAIICEPTSLAPGIAGKGYGLARITIEGKEAHSAFPQQGVSAIAIAARLIARIEDTLDHASIVEDHLFDPPRTTINIGQISGGTAKNIIPGRCTFLVEWRSIPGDPPSRVLAHLETLLRETRAANPSARLQLENLRGEPGFAPALSGRLQNQLKALLPADSIGISFGSEASRVAHIADEVIVVGPGDMRTAHSNRECVPIAELEQWTDTLARLIRE